MVLCIINEAVATRSVGRICKGVPCSILQGRVWEGLSPHTPSPAGYL